MQAKSKSIKRRRRADATQVVDAVESMVSRANALLDVIKRMVSCSTEGSNLYVAVVELVDDLPASDQPTEAVWERCLRAVAFEDLKTARWEAFFTDTFQKCQVCLSSPHGTNYLTLLCSQIGQKLIKGVSKFNQDGLSYLTGFIDELAKHARIFDPVLSDGQQERNAFVISCVQTMLDFSAPPSKVVECCQIFASHKEQDHWLAKCFDLDKGKKIIEASLENARNRQASSNVLDSLLSATSKLEKHDLHDVDIASRGEYQGEKFTVDFAKDIVSAFAALKDEGQL